MFDRIRLSRFITLALASCAVTWAFAGSALARPDVQPNAEVAPPPSYKVVPGDTDKAPSANRPPAFKGIVVDANKTPDPAVVDRNLASLGRGPKTTGVVVARRRQHRHDRADHGHRRHARRARRRHVHRRPPAAGPGDARLRLHSSR